MTENHTSALNTQERIEAFGIVRRLLRHPELRDNASVEARKLFDAIVGCASEAGLERNTLGIHPLLHDLRTAATFTDGICADMPIIAAIMLRNLNHPDAVPALWGDDVEIMVNGLHKAASLYSHGSASLGSDNFRNLLLTFARDIRVIMIMIADRVAMMRAANHHPDEDFVRSLSAEAAYLYAPLAHRLGLYKLKSELEDLSLKYTNREIYTRIAKRLNETKAKRDKYIADFIGPVSEKLREHGLKFDIKGRTKSIFSIWNKMKKQRIDLDHIYDLFAIRIIIDDEPEAEKRDCWMAYSIIGDMYRPNPSRMKDWISIPKSNGYESLHGTVRGPEDKWVEVQIRTRRMDLIAEKGFAAHWKYKGLKSEGDLDVWMNNVRDILETAESGPMELMKNLKLDIYDKEVFVFTPKGDLYRLPLGASVLDFAFHIHSDLGSKCTGARVNGHVEKLGYKLRSGDSVEILTSSTQTPKQDWLNLVATSKARNKIRQTLHERQSAGADMAREMLMRRFKNRKINVDDALLMKLIKKQGYKTVTDFYLAIASEQLDVNTVIDAYERLAQADVAAAAAEVRSASEFVMQTDDASNADSDNGGRDVLVIGGGDIKGFNYKMARCCNPIYGDDVFGFISSEGVVKVHRTDCPNAAHIRDRYPYRIITTRWSGKIGGQFAATLRIVGQDDLGIVTNISSIINKEKDVSLRNISIDSDDGLFQGYVVVGVNDIRSLNGLIKKLQTVKGVKEVTR